MVLRSKVVIKHHKLDATKTLLAKPCLKDAILLHTNLLTVKVKKGKGRQFV